MNEFMDDVIDRLARIETKVDALKDHEPRIRNLENTRWILVGGGAVTVFAIEAALRFVK